MKRKNSARQRLIRLGMPLAVAAAALTVAPDTTALALDEGLGNVNPDGNADGNSGSPSNNSGEPNGGNEGQGNDGGPAGETGGGNDNPVGGGSAQGSDGQDGNDSGQDNLSQNEGENGAGGTGQGNDGQVGVPGQNGEPGQDGVEGSGGDGNNANTGGNGQDGTPQNEGEDNAGGNGQPMQNGGSDQPNASQGLGENGTEGAAQGNDGDGSDPTLEGNGQDGVPQNEGENGTGGTDGAGQDGQSGAGEGEEGSGEGEEGSGEDASGQSDAPVDGGVKKMSLKSAARTLGNPQNNGENQQSAVSYDYDAELYKPAEDKTYAGVYTTKIKENEKTDFSETIGMPSIADANLADAPTTESPAIITGAAVGYETRDMGKPVEQSFTPADAKRDAPYSYFNHGFMTEKAPDGTEHTKLTGFDSTYVITRIDLTDYLNTVAGGFGITNTTPAEGKTQKETLQEALQGKFLHVKQENNNTLMAVLGVEEKTTESGGTTTTLLKTFSDALGTKTGAYSMAALFDEGGLDPDKPYFDVIIFATASNVAGADVGKETARNGDVKLSFYVDETDDYNPELKYDPTSTDPNHLTNVLAKYFNYEESSSKKTTQLFSALSTYTLKGSDLALEVMVDEGEGKTTYWSLKKAIEKGYYDQEIDKSATDTGCGRTVKLMSEVAIADGLNVTGQEGALKKRTLDVNSFDIQVAKNSADAQGEHPVQISMENAWLKIADYSNTTGSELAIGNNAQMTVKKGGKLIIDKTCQLEVEWDSASKTPKEGEATPKPDILNNGLLNIEAGGELQNDGIITIEGTEGKPYSEQNKDSATTSEKGFGELTIKQGAKLTNNGSMMVYGRLYNLGTIVNNGSYNDTIDSNDPDKGLFSYHKGIIASWKDDVTQQNVTYGSIVNGQDHDGNKNPNAVIINNGDIVLNPGELDNYARLVMNSGSNIYTCTATEAIIPIEPAKQAEPGQTPPPQTKRITLDPPKPSKIVNDGTIIMDQARMATGKIELKDNGGFGALTLTNETVPYEGSGLIIRVKRPDPRPIPGPHVDPGRDPFAPDTDPDGDGRDDRDDDPIYPDWIDPADPSQNRRRTPVIDVIVDGSPSHWTVGGDAAGGATLVEVDEGVYRVASMPAVSLEEIVEAIALTDPDFAEELAGLLKTGDVNAWWCAEVGGKTVRIMDTGGNLAPNVADVRIVFSADGEASIIVEFKDGSYAVFTSFDDFFIELEPLGRL